MFTNKEFEQSVLDKLDSLEKSVKNSQKKQDEKYEKLDSELQRLHKTVVTLSESQEKVIHDKNTALTRINDTADDFSKKLLAFENTKNRIEKSIHETLARQLELIVQKITYELKTFDSVHSDVKDISVQIAQIRPELERFHSAAKHIKDVDFTLHKHARDLELSDNKKLQLDRENEKLKMMIAKMKQRR